MQELIIHLEMLKSKVDMADINSLIDYANSSLEKEKEQIVDAYYGKIYGVFDYREEGQEYYNETYNQNK